MSSLLCPDMAAAAEILNSGGVLIYPTETFPALGCRHDAPEAMAAIAAVKGRAASQTLPLLCSSVEQAAQLADLSQAPEELINFFWPGPLTIVIAPLTPAASAIANGQGKIALRVSSHPDSARLAALAGPLTSSSANLHGEPPIVNADELTPAFLAALTQIHLPFGIFKGNFKGRAPLHQPSTIVEPLLIHGRWRLRLLRQGAIAAHQLSPYWELIK